MSHSMQSHFDAYNSAPFQAHIDVYYDDLEYIFNFNSGSRFEFDGNIMINDILYENIHGIISSDQIFTSTYNIYQDQMLIAVFTVDMNLAFENHIINFIQPQ